MTSQQFPGLAQRQIRTLKIEVAGDAWLDSIKPKIRLAGHWLEKAGFKPGEHVQVICTAPGVMELHSLNLPVESETQPAMMTQADFGLL